MQNKGLIAAIAPLALCAMAAMAQEAPPPPQPDGRMQAKSVDKAEMQKHFVAMCTDRYAREVGELAYLETELALSPAQKPLFDRWKAAKLANARARQADCSAQTPPDAPPSLVERLKHDVKTAKQKLDEINAEMPALEALAGTLSTEQARAFDHRGPMGAMGPDVDCRSHMPPGRGGAMGHDAPPPDGDPPPRP